MERGKVATHLPRWVPLPHQQPLPEFFPVILTIFILWENHQFCGDGSDAQDTQHAMRPCHKGL